MTNNRENSIKGLIDKEHMLILMLIIVGYVVVTKKNLPPEVYVTIIAIIKLFTGIITMLKTSKKEEKYIDCLAVGLIVIAVGTLIGVNFDKRVIEFSTYTTYELLIIPSSIILYKAFNKKIQYLLMHVLIFILIVAFRYITGTNDYLLESTYMGLSESFIIITSLVIFSLWIIYYVKDEGIDKYKKTVATISISLWVVYLVENFENSIGLMDINSFFIIKLLIYMCLYEKIEETFLINAYNEAKNNCEKELKTKSKLNHSLLEREKRLTEINNAVLKSEKRYEDLIESISDGIVIFKNGKVDYINGQAIYLLIQNTEKNIKNITVDDVLKLFNIESVLQENLKSGIIKRCEIKDFDNSIIYLEVIMVNTICDNIILLIKNITEEVMLDEVKEKYTQEKTNFDLKSKFYSNVSHELRTPINVINSAIQLNEVYIDNNQLRNLKNSNKVIKQNCLRLIRTINNFMDTNRITEGFLEANTQVYNVVAIIENVALASNKYIKMKNMRLVIEPELEEIYLPCDKEHLERIMLNILSNTIKYGVVDGEIYIGITIEDENLKVVVKNNNKPISKEDFDKVFEDFQKLDETFSRNTEGSGLGMFLTKELVRINNGTIDIISHENEGNSFIITLPIIYNGEQWIVEDSHGINEMEEKVDIEFADIYF